MSTDNKKTICVYCSSSNNLPEKFYVMSKELGEKIGKNGYNMVYGGTTVGMMGVIANNALENGADVNYLDENGFNALHYLLSARYISYISYPNLIFSKIGYKNIGINEKKSMADIVELLYKNGIDINSALKDLKILKGLLSVRIYRFPKGEQHHPQGFL